MIKIAANKRIVRNFICTSKGFFTQRRKAPHLPLRRCVRKTH